MIYTKFGSRLTLLGRLLDNNGRLAIQATAEGATQVREYQVSDLKADDGSPEIKKAIEQLPWKVQTATVRRSR